VKQPPRKGELAIGNVRLWIQHLVVGGGGKLLVHQLITNSKECAIHFSRNYSEVWLNYNIVRQLYEDLV
jgi:hypothetical protein